MGNAGCCPSAPPPTSPSRSRRLGRKNPVTHRRIPGYFPWLPPPAVLPIDLSHPLTLPPKVLPREKPDLNGRLHDVPHQPGVYLMRDRLGKIIYVGKAKNLRKRLSNYFQPARSRMADLKTRSLIKSIWDFEFHVVRNEPESLLLESKLIKEYRPKYNISLRDDKRFLLLKMHPAEPWPRFFLTRTRKDDGARYFGPFAHSGSLRTTLHWMQHQFGLRSCRPVEPGETDYKTIPGLLSAITQPSERAAVIETLMTLRFATDEGPVDQSAGKAASEQKTLSLFQTPEDKQAAARVVPFFTNLTETQRQDILSRLK